ncbi:hypothetical protein [Microbacterium maritypicum]
MMFFVVGVAMFVNGVVVDRVGRVLGTVLALVPIAAYFVYLAIIQLDGKLDDREYADSGLVMLVGILAFASAPTAISLVRAWRDRRQGEASED